MNNWRMSLRYLGCMLSLGFLATGVGAQELYNFTFTALGSMGGSLDADPDPGLSNTGFQLGASLVTESRVHGALRLGVLDFGDELVGSLSDADLTYATLAGEYHFHEGWYDSGLIIGVGGYQLEGIQGGLKEEETSWGVTVGVNGYFELTRRFSLVAEVTGHWVDFDDANIFAMAHLGLAFHW